jgi:hypothetical protein
VAGTDADMSYRIANTFTALTKLADFKAETAGLEEDNKKNVEEEIDEKPSPKAGVKGLRTEFHYNIQVQLPSNGTEETYLNIFNAIRKTFQ